MMQKHPVIIFANHVREFRLVQVMSSFKETAAVKIVKNNAFRECLLLELCIISCIINEKF